MTAEVPDTMIVQVLEGAGKIRPVKCPVPSPGPGEVLLKVAFCGICNSDIPRYSHAEVYRLPLVLGHEFSGRVALLGEAVTQCEVGERFAVYPLIPCHGCDSCKSGFYNLCKDYDFFGSRRDGALAQYVTVPVENLVPVPREVPLDVAALTEPCAVAHHASMVGRAGGGEDIVIFGSGLIGLVVAEWVRAMGARRIWLVDIDPRKEEIARGLGFDLFLNPRKDDVEKIIRDETALRMADIAFEVAGVAEALLSAIRTVGHHGKVVVVGNPTADVILSKELISSLLRREIEIHGVWGTNILPKGRSDWDLTIQAFRDGKLSLAGLISHRYPLNSVPEALAMLAEGREFHSRVLIQVDEEQS